MRACATAKLWLGFCKRSCLHCALFATVFLALTLLSIFTYFIYVCFVVKWLYVYWKGADKRATICIYDTGSPRLSLLKYFIFSEPSLRAFNLISALTGSKNTRNRVFTLSFIKQRLNAFFLVLLTGLPFIYVKHLNSFIECFDEYGYVSVDDIDDFICYFLNKQ